MTAHALLKSYLAERKTPRYIFRRRCLMSVGTDTLNIRTLDVSEHGFGVIASEPVKAGRKCTVILNGVVGGCITQHVFTCETMYCILAGVSGFRLGLQINDCSAQLQKKQLEKIIASCTPSFS